MCGFYILYDRLSENQRIKTDGLTSLWIHPFLSICLLVIVWVINTLYESLAVIDLVCQGRLYKSLYVRSVNETILHGIQIVVLVNPVPVPHIFATAS